MCVRSVVRHAQCGGIDGRNFKVSDGKLSLVNGGEVVIKRRDMYVMRCVARVYASARAAENKYV